MYGNLFAAAEMYAAVVDACTIPARDFLEGGWERDRVVADDHLDSHESNHHPSAQAQSFAQHCYCPVSGLPDHIHKRVVNRRTTGCRNCVVMLHYSDLRTALVFKFFDSVDYKKRSVSSSRASQMVRITHLLLRVSQVFHIWLLSAYRNAP